MIYDLFTEFGVTQHTEIDFDLDNATPAPGAVRKKCHDIRRKIEDELGAQPYKHIHAICGADFFDDLITRSEVAKAYDRYLDGAFLRQGQARGSFEYAGIVFEEYRGRVGTVDFTDASKAYFFPVGVPGLFRQYNAPADFVETANTIAVTLPKPMTSGAKAEGRFGRQDLVYQPAEDVYRCPAGATLEYHYTNVENGLTLRRYWTVACPSCPIKSHCTPAKERRITRWQHEHVLEAVQRRLDENPTAMRQRRATVEHPFGTIKARMGAVHFLLKTLPRVSGEMALHVLAYNLTRVMNIVGSRVLIAAIRA